MFLSHHLQLLWNTVPSEYHGNQKLQQKTKKNSWHYWEMVFFTLEDEFHKSDFSLNPALFSSHILQAFQSNVIIITLHPSLLSHPVTFSFKDTGWGMWKCISLGSEQCSHEGECQELWAVLYQFWAPDPEWQGHTPAFNKFVCDCGMWTTLKQV